MHSVLSFLISSTPSIDGESLCVLLIALDVYGIHNNSKYLFPFISRVDVIFSSLSLSDAMKSRTVQREQVRRGPWETLSFSSTKYEILLLLLLLLEITSFILYFCCFEGCFAGCCYRAHTAG
jgi:hypothetical protein